MYEIKQTQAYSAWFAALRDQRAKGLITSRLFRLTLGHFGDAKSVGAGVHELRIAFGPGYRVNFYQALRADRAAAVRRRQR